MSNSPQQTGNLPLAIVGGLVAALLAAIAWGAITASVEFQIGYMAIGVGFVVAFAMRFLGNGHDDRFKWAAAIISLLGCVLGNYLAACAVYANAHHANVLDIITSFMPHFFGVMQATFQAMDLVFYAMGAYFGYRYAATPPKPTAPATAPAE